MNPRGNFAFHSGYLFSIPNTAAPTPRRIATLQEVSFSFKGTNKELMGEMQFAEAVGRADIKITGKAKTAKFSADAFNDIFFNQAAVTGHKKIAYDEPGAIDIAGTYTPVNGATFVQDLGVADIESGKQLTRVATLPQVGQYKVDDATGEYTFNAGDKDKAILVSYVYNEATTGKTIPIVNLLAGEAPTFQALFVNKFQGETIYLKLNAAVAENLDFGFKSGDFAMPDFGFMAQADENGNVGEYSQSRA